MTEGEGRGIYGHRGTEKMCGAKLRLLLPNAKNDNAAINASEG